jgi:hypothetical protein
VATATIPAIPAKERVAFLVMMTPRKKTTALIDSTRFCVPAEKRSQIRTGRFLIVVVVSQSALSRHWIVTIIYTARKITGGIMVWKKI